ncbi:WD40-repeat-containing domain protein [Gongronella butleri]|nr:WD40-repeat-containing domain protein [Gongronella butleri]
MQIQSLSQFDTGYSADSVEFCPFEDNYEYLVCGTYQLLDDEQDRQRKGKLFLLNVQNDKAEYQVNQVLDTHAILDMKWNHVPMDGQQILGVVDSMDGFSMYRLVSGQLELLQRIPVLQDSSILSLSLDWASRRHSSSNDCVVSHSNGSLSLLQPQTHGIGNIRTWQAHDLEAWIAAFDYWDTWRVYSGADDMMFRGWDTRTDLSQPIFTYRRHDMGVTTIQSNPHREHVLATGSYDEHVYLWDIRNTRAPTSTIHTPGGGIWRLKWHPSNPAILLSASMHAGAFVLDTDKGQVANSFLDHESMAYGADWSYGSPDLGD